MDLLRMSHNNFRMICKNRFQQLQTKVLNEINQREKFRILSISQEANVVQDLEEGIRRKSESMLLSRTRHASKVVP